MKIFILATAAALSLSGGSAYADSEGGTAVETLFTQIPGVMARSPAQKAPSDATGQKDRPVQAADKRSQGLGTWLLRTFPLP
jgi:hypothetical protein